MEFFQFQGVSIAYVDLRADEGANDPVILIHGFASNHLVNWVNTSWSRTLNRAGFRVIALDNRGHGQSGKLYAPEDYSAAIMAEDAGALMDHLGIARADVMGYSMGARIATFLALKSPERVRSLLLGGLGIRLIEGGGLPSGIAEAMETPSLASLTDPAQRMFRQFAEQTGSDLLALAACMRGSRQRVSVEEFSALAMPVMVSVGTRDPIAGDPHRLAALARNGQAFDVLDRDHNSAVGDRSHKEAVLAFLARRP